MDNGLSDLPPHLASRVDLCLDTSRLTKPSSRSTVWRNHLSKVAANSHKLTEAQVDALGEQKMSVQEIASTVKMAYLLAKRDPWDPDVLCISHIQRVMKIRGKNDGKAKGAKKPVTPQVAQAKSDGLGSDQKVELTPDMSVNATATTSETGKASQQPLNWGNWCKGKKVSQGLAVEDDVPEDPTMEEKMNEEIQAATDVVKGDEKHEEGKNKENSRAPATNDEWSFWDLPAKKSKAKKKIGWKGWEFAIEETEKAKVAEQQTHTDPPGAAAETCVPQPDRAEDQLDLWGSFGKKKDNKKKKERELQRISSIAEPGDVVKEHVEADMAEKDEAIKPTEGEALTDTWGFKKKAEEIGNFGTKKSSNGFDFGNFDDLLAPNNKPEPEAQSTNEEPPKQNPSSCGTWAYASDFGPKDQETKAEAVPVNDFDCGILSKPKKTTKKPTKKSTKKSKAPPKEDPPLEPPPEAPPVEGAPILEEEQPPAIPTDPASPEAEADTPEKLKSAVDEYITEMKAKLDALGQSWTAEGRVMLNDKDTGIAKILRDIKYKTVDFRTRSTNVFEPGI